MNRKKILFEVRQGAYIFNDNNQLLILKNKKCTWGIVGGHLEYNETAKEGLFREIKEETNLEVKFISYLNTVVREKDFILVCVAKYKCGNVKLSHEHDDWKWVDLQDLKKYNLTFPQLKEEADKALRIYSNMKFNKLIPELSVSDFEKSLKFYTKILKFKIKYQREESKFAFLSFQGSQIMIDQGNNEEDSPWFTGKLEYPRGGGIHFQFEVDKIQPILNNLNKNNYPIKVEPKEYWFRKENELMGMKGFLVMDPDGYLLMFNEDIGTKPL